MIEISLTTNVDASDNDLWDATCGEYTVESDDRFDAVGRLIMLLAGIENPPVKVTYLDPRPIRM